MKSKVKNILNILLVALCFTTLGVSAATFINSKEVIYDNSISGIQSTNVQSAVDELYSAATDYSSLNQRISNLENNFLDKTYPVGSVYISTTDDTIEKVKEKFGGEWESYAEGRTLIGVGTGTDSKGVVKTFKANSTGGEYKHTLSVNEMPSHKHLIYQYAYNNDSKKYAIVTGYGDNAVAPAAQISIIQNSLNNSALGPDSGDSTKGLVNADYTGGSKAHNIVQPYITTYMYKRVK